MKYKELSQADLFISAAKNKDIDDIACRVFLYLIGKEMWLTTSNQNLALSFVKVADEIGITNQELYHGLSLLAKHELINPAIVKNIKLQLENNKEEHLTTKDPNTLVVTDLNDNGREIFTVEIINNITHYNFIIPINYNTASIILRSIEGSILVDILLNESLLNLSAASKDLKKTIHYSKKTLNYIIKEKLDREENIRHILNVMDSTIEENSGFQALFKDNI